ncbi:hypothetical protein BDQ17DRAFT_1237502 [Cyathus striatus]|nr:hypothetical protein BDQ17DRAFT_1237502 [Cyathus striatus]
MNIYIPDREWTTKHAHFLQMGGFQYRDGHRTTVLYPDQFHDLLQKGEIVFPNISTEDITDKSKANGLSKIILVTQVFWFVTQCIARLVQGLALAQLEVTTLSIISCTFILSIIWWHKPFDVRQPVILDKTVDMKSNAETSTPNMEIKENVSQKLADEHNNASCDNCPSLDNVNAKADSSTSRSECSELLEVPQIVIDYYDDELQEFIIHLIFMVIFVLSTVALGLVHCIAWNSDFPSTAERTLWRISSILTATAPLLDTAIDWQHVCLNIVLWVTTVVVFIGLPFYVVARLYLLMEAFLSLRALPPSAFDTVEWVYFFPHI